jgi:hypothetical protein
VHVDAFKLVLTFFLLTAWVPSASAWDAALEVPVLRAPTLSWPQATSTFAISAVQAGQLAAASQDHPAPGPRISTRDEPKTDLRTYRKLRRAGYGLAAGAGMFLGGLIVATQAVPKNGVCSEFPERRRNFGITSTAFMAAGAALSSGMIVRLIRLRRAHPQLRASKAARAGQALLGITAAGAVSTILTAAVISCST